MQIARHLWIIVVAALLVISLPSVAAEAPHKTPVVDSSAFLKRLNQNTTSFAKYVYLTSAEVQNNPGLKDMAAQMVPTLTSFLGRPADAVNTFPFDKKPSADAPLPSLSGFSAMPADVWIAGQAKEYRVVMLNEAHHRAETRLLTLEMLPELRSIGYTHFAVETLGDFDKSLEKRGYATANTGFYTAEPVFAEIIREAIRLGYVLVPYEASGGSLETQQLREDAQAKNLFERTVKDNPVAKVLVHAGYAHISESELPGFGKPMAMQFKALSGLEVLSIDQTKLFAYQTQEKSLPKSVKRLPMTSEPSVLINMEQKAWSAFPGQMDATLLLPAHDSASPHPAWLALGNRRQQAIIDLSPCRGHLPCLAEARHASEPDEAVPADQFLMLDDNETGIPLYLAPGKYRLRLLGREGTTLVVRELVVSSKGEAAK